MQMLSKLFGKKKKQAEKEVQSVLPKGEIAYEQAKELARSEDPRIRKALAARGDVRPEILYYLAEDDDPRVRRTIVENEATPPHAHLLLARDEDDEVRAALALKIGRLLPDLEEDAKNQVRELTLQTLEVLAQDQLTKVRALLSEELKTSLNAPKEIIKRLAQDVEAIVAAPVLEYSPLLSDEDLVEIIVAGVAQGALPAVARRENLSAEVADAVVATLDVPAVSALLLNPSAQIREDTLDRIIDQAEEFEALHEPLVMRPELSIRAMKRISQFVALALVDKLVEKHDLPKDVVDELNQAVRERINKEDATNPDDEARRQVEALIEKGKLNEKAVSGWAKAGKRDLVEFSLAHMAELPVSVVRKIMRARSGKAVSALVWKAGMSMRTAVIIQQNVLRLTGGEILNARNGVDYPLSSEELAWQLELFNA